MLAIEDAVYSIRRLHQDKMREASRCLNSAATVLMHYHTGATLNARAVDQSDLFDAVYNTGEGVGIALTCVRGSNASALRGVAWRICSCVSKHILDGSASSLELFEVGERLEKLSEELWEEANDE